MRLISLALTVAVVGACDRSEEPEFSRPPAAAEEDAVPAPNDVASPPGDATRTASGLATKVLQAGEGQAHPGPNDTVRVRYTGWTTDGEMFDTTERRGKPAELELTQVIAGWREALQSMTVGEKRRLWVPEALAYRGRRGRPQGTLVFDVELVELVAGPPGAPPDVAAPPDDAERTASGLAHKLLSEGSGDRHPGPTDQVRVHYSGWTTDGEMFDSSVSRGEPSEFPLNGVIAGWTEGLQLMVVGEKRRFWIPEDQAYGGQPGRPQGMLVFDVELLAILD